MLSIRAYVMLYYGSEGGLEDSIFELEETMHCNTIFLWECFRRRLFNGVIMVYLSLTLLFSISDRLCNRMDDSCFSRKAEAVPCIPHRF